MANRRKYDATYRPYSDDFHPSDLLLRMSEGQTNVQVWAAWNISENTFYRWLNEHTALMEAYETGKVKFEAWFIENRFNPMIEGKLTGKHAFLSSMAIANNKLGWKKDTADSRTTNVNIQQMNVLNQKDTKELESLIMANFEYLTSMNVIDVKAEEVKQIPDDTKSNGEN